MLHKITINDVVSKPKRGYMHVTEYAKDHKGDSYKTHSLAARH